MALARARHAVGVANALSQCAQAATTTGEALARAVAAHTPGHGKQATADSAQRSRSRANPSAAQARPRVLLGAEPASVRSFLITALRADGGRLRLLPAVTGNTDALALAIIEQPDLVVLGPHSLARLALHEDGAEDLLAQLRRYCPDSHTLALLDPASELPSKILTRVEGRIPYGDPRALLADLHALLGPPPSPPRGRTAAGIQP